MEFELENNLAVSITLHPSWTNNVQLDTLLSAPTSGSSSNDNLHPTPSWSFTKTTQSRHLSHPPSLPPFPLSFRLLPPSIMRLRKPQVHARNTTLYTPDPAFFLLFFFDLRNTPSSRAGKHRSNVFRVCGSWIHLINTERPDRLVPMLLLFFPFSYSFSQRYDCSCFDFHRDSVWNFNISSLVFIFSN